MVPALSFVDNLKLDNYSYRDPKFACHMLNQRRLTWLTILLVVAALIGFPANTLYNHWCGVKAIGRLDSYQISGTSPWWHETVNQSWYSKLFGQVLSLTTYHQTVDLGQMRDFAKLRGLKSLGFKEATDEAWTSLPRQIHQLDVSLPESGLSTVAWEAIGRLQHLKHLCLRGQPQSEFEPAHVPPGTPATGEVQVHLTPVSVATIEKILELRTLSKLSIHHTGLTDQAVERISGHPGITALDLHDNHALTDACLAHLARMPALKKLTVSVVPSEARGNGMPQTSLSEEGLEKLRKLRPDMTVTDMNQPTPP